MNFTNSILADCGLKHILIEKHDTISCLLFPTNMFDLITAVNTYYYWPNLVNDMKEVLRVLKSGGNLIILGEGYKGGKHQDRNRKYLN